MNNSLGNPLVSGASGASGISASLDADAVKPALQAPAPGAGATADAAYKAKATEAAVKFEGYFISQMLHQMRAGTNALASKDSAENDPTNSDMLDMVDTMVADKLAGQRAFGVADMILRQLLPPAAPAPTPASTTKVPHINTVATSNPGNIATALNNRD
jgi:flagellar protein FlgJ